MPDRDGSVVVPGRARTTGGLFPLGSAPRRLLLARLQYARALTGERARELAIAEAYDAVGRHGW